MIDGKHEYDNSDNDDVYNNKDKDDDSDFFNSTYIAE